MASSGSQQIVSNMWELSLYELHRRPHEMVADSSAIAVSPRALHSELMCPICLDLMTNTQTTKECLHRFCQECIITALRSGNKECPTCRKKLVSKRSLRPDPNFDALIAKIYPDREELINQQERYTPRRSVHLNQRKRKTPPPEDEEEEEEEEIRPPLEKRVCPDQEDFFPLSEPSTPPSSHNESIDSDVVEKEVELQLRPHPNQAQVSDHAIRNLVTSPLCTVSHLVKYLSINKVLEKDILKHRGSAVRALSYTETSVEGSGRGKYSLYASSGVDDTDYSALSRGTPLKQIMETYWIPGDKLKLYFTKDDIES